MTRLRARAALACASALFTLACSTPNGPPKVSAAANANVTHATDMLAAADAQRLQALATRMDAMAVELIRFWKSHGPDATYGGFHGTLDRTGQATTPTDKGLIQESRHLWTFSTWYARRERSEAVRAIAENLYRFLIDHFRDPSDGEFFFKVSREGRAIETKKPLYAQSFAIYALATYAETFGSEAAKQQALACFRSLDRRAHDARYGGYDQSQDPFFFTPGTQKQTNTHIHLLESFAELYRATGNAVVRARLSELLQLTAKKIVQTSGYARQEFKLDFTPFAETKASYGHDIETSWLLLDAADALGQSDPEISGIAFKLGETAALRGFDAKDGGLFEAGEPGAPPSELQKVWWVQAEALAGLFQLYRAERLALDLDRLERTLTFIEQRQTDHDYGEWYWSMSPDGSVGPHGTNKGEEWKASYHDVRALVFTSDWIKSFLKQHAR